MTAAVHPAHATLRPRAVAMLVALRRGPRTVAQLADALGDPSTGDTKRLVAAMDGSDRRDPAYVAIASNRVALTETGVGWLETHGVAVTGSPFSLSRHAG